ncbi:unnamed protein product [Spirodela intermedia]|uniref:Reelin domain-containing protein n=2 Tax=Spirodela intermedia TaxID=51605 RepID=A0A7I8J3Q1_SPIIN|nr:unnamed protein product [Spirodela intermedia]CAA6664720.1 unnamed protein product [Spirodela intermedia]CAA7401319.1 unnamed protein product [Spirodela intermedia]
MTFLWSLPDTFDHCLIILAFIASLN